MMAPNFSLDLHTIEFPDGDPYRDPDVYRAHERFWWHAEIAAELKRLEAQGFPAACLKGIAGNIRRGEYDTAKNLRMMLTWGEVVKAAPLHDFEPDSWVRLALPGEAAELAQKPAEIAFWESQNDADEEVAA